LVAVIVSVTVCPAYAPSEAVVRNQALEVLAFDTFVPLTAKTTVS
jgi:hypothetical protein